MKVVESLALAVQCFLKTASYQKIISMQNNNSNNDTHTHPVHKDDINFLINNMSTC